MGELASTRQLRMSFARWTLVTVPLVVFLGLLMGRLSNSGFGNAWFDTLATNAHPRGNEYDAGGTCTHRRPMNDTELAIATITLARRPEEEDLLLRGLAALAASHLPVFVTDGGSASSFLERARRIAALSAGVTGSRPASRMWPRIRTYTLSQPAVV